MASNIVQLLDEKIKIENWIGSVLYGSVEVRVRKSKKYIYVHYRKQDKIVTKYAGEYSARLLNIISENTLLAKELKKRLKAINKQLKSLNYKEKDVGSNIKSSIKFANANLISIIQEQLLTEGLNIDFNDIRLLIEDGIINNISIDNANKINNLKNAWNFILNKDVINAGLSFSLLSQINSLIDNGFSYNAGKLRRIPLHIEDCSYIPSIPFEEDLNKLFTDISKSKEKPFDKALNILVYLLRHFVFTNSNTNTALIFANYYLIKNGLGYFNILNIHKDELDEALFDLYQWYDTKKIKKLLVEKCYFEK